MADTIERYAREHPQAGDTASGISQWWVEDHGGSPADVQQALDYLVENGRLSRIVLADGTVIYARAGPPD
jgi:Fe2+ or Zn2+ uptake regulation protein